MFFFNNDKLVLIIFYAYFILFINNSSSAQQDIVSVENLVVNTFDQITSDPQVQAALLRILETEPQTIREQFRITEIPAPPFKEDRRADKRVLRKVGCADAAQKAPRRVRYATCNESLADYKQITLTGMDRA